ncbi:hypothetical protein HYG89_04880 [Acinetobacter sp. SwsAc5]|uniref:hypothetical protein n=1 Tax=Acinetobacter sp. SwsAc5 TaxID=2749438 RepID=UPI0015C02E7A|nr:hypothetical protein [Acinetobacter sp. SwsAc5]NWK51900.1 hypothetical protein [Acinetobacter sp. SwsAc5]
MQAILNCVSVGNCRYWMTSTIPTEKVNSVIPKLISKYSLDLNQDQRYQLSRQGKPIWTLIVNYNPSEVGYLTFWLFTTGFKSTDRSSKKLNEDVGLLNTRLKREENLMNVITQNPNELIKFKEYVLGQYVIYDDMKDSLSKEYLTPSRFGVPLVQSKFNAQGKSDAALSIRSIDGSNDSISLGSAVAKSDEQKYESIKKNFGFLYLKDMDKDKSYNYDQAIAELHKSYGVKVEPNTPYNEVMRLLFKHYNRTNNRYLHIFKRKSKKSVRFTWYFTQEYLDRLALEMRRKLIDIPKNPDGFEQSFKRLYSRGNFHGVRHQIGLINAKVRSDLKRNYPNIYSKLSFPTKLHYVRFSPNPYTKFKEFHNDCIIASITLEKMKQQEELRKVHNRKLRKVIRASSDELKEASVTTINMLINQTEPNKYENFDITAEDIINFIQRYKVMDPIFISDTF